MKKKVLCGSLLLIAVIGVFGMKTFVFSDAQTNKTLQKTYYKPEEGNGVCFEYYQNKEGKWCVNGHEYAERMVLKGIMPSTTCETEYVVLTNDTGITYEDVNTSIISSNSHSELDSARACIVEIR